MPHKLIASEPYCSSSLERLRASLSEAVAWCESRARADDPRGSLRRLPDPVDVEHLGLLGLTPANLVRTTSWRRDEELKAARLTVPTIQWAALPGRLLVFFPDEETQDGGAEVQSEGFFDDHNTPPWDTWVGFFTDLHDEPAGPTVRSYLLAYVPAAFVGHVGRGIEVNPERCIQWLEDSETALAVLVQQARA
ncbi:hypothetical protein [Pyxidicoccus caerfyrddinensis]|uniref:hypothetical protein n=1 Tax=Pyxidicoccus caerfyrddinensis TaxID=2709663 RepID=UPI0013DAD3A0|nr:hypothetical protein [Pyxidicoccus caerfyrddinensis]